MSNVFMTLDKRADFKPVSNYFAAMSAALAMAWRITGAEEYKEKAEYWRDRVIERIDEEGILYGEGYPMSADDGSHTIDMGYNLEESIPLMLLYASLTGDREDFFRQRMRDHLAFLLPDGGIDNSFGSRHNKWTYWGSRTSDGLIEGLCLALDDAVMAEACERVLSMYERSTHDGLLAMPMAHEAGEPTCLHHTFAHAKALAALVCADEFEKTEHTLIPCEEKWGVRKYQNGRLLLVSSGAFRATFSAVDARYLPAYAANGGGSMNLLYHEKHGVLCAATSVEYDPSEPLNQQYLRNAPNPECMTAQFEIDGRLASLEDGVKLSYKGLEVVSEGEGWRASYAFDSDRLTIRLLSEKGIYRLPIVTSKFTRPRLSEDKLTLVFESGLSVTSNRPMDVDVERRVFHQVGGLMYLPIRIPVGDEVTVTIE